MIKVFLVDDHAVVRAGFKAMLPVEGDIEVVGDWGGGVGAAEAALKSGADVVLLDIRMPDRNGLDVLHDLRARDPTAKVIMLTTSEADNDVYEALRGGARGYVVKDRDADDVYAAIRSVAAGGRFVPGPVQDLYLERQRMGDFTPREAEVLAELAKGFSNAEIGTRLEISPETVKNHIKSIYQKLGVNDRVTAVSEAYRRGFLRWEA